MKTIGFIGGGRITRIILNGFKNAGVTFDAINVYETNDFVSGALRSDYPYIITTAIDPSPAASSDWLFIALHPPVFMECLEKIKNFIKKDALVVSLAPKITLEKMQSVLVQTRNLVRMNPNAGSYMNKGFNPVCYSAQADNNSVGTFITVFEKLGKIPVVPEKHIEAYAMISAMGHTYFWFQLEELGKLALSYGLSESEAQEALTSMLWGTTETLFNSGLPYEKVTDLVPVKPLLEHEDAIRGYYKTCLNGLYNKIKPQI